MTSKFVGKENNVVSFTISFTAEEFEEGLVKAYNKAKGSITIDGFRKGKAPRTIIERKYGETVFFEDAIDIMLNEAYPKALDELKVEPISSPKIDFGKDKIEKGKDFTVSFSVDVAPEIVAKDYKGVEAERKVKEITDADVDAELLAVQKRNARSVSVDREAKLEDTVILDYAGFVGEEQFEGGTAENQSLKLGSGQFIPGFEDQLVGTKAGDSKDVKVTFPTEYHAENLAGKEAVFKCTIHEVKEEQLPELNDDFAVDVSDFDTLEEYKKDIKAKLEESAKNAAEYSGKNAVMEKVYAANPVSVPQSMINDETENMLAEFEQNMKYQGLDLKSYCKFTNQTLEQLKDGFKADAEKRVASRLVVKAIAQQENIEATEEDVAKEIADMAKQYGMEEDKVKTALAGQMNYIKDDIKMRKAIDFVYSNAKVKDVIDKPADKAPKADK